VGLALEFSTMYNVASTMPLFIRCASRINACSGESSSIAIYDNASATASMIFMPESQAATQVQKL
jgi:hypothetical protein